ncbi:SDR family NAD(P)-dependent oxidoreductase [Maliponia aquimaris]|uniref:3-oxoacyl-[acyl-carrier-protein] reductase FabG n=1 Tax=Maliponia aquimaris TaxID=1673631 RepID=A0A238KNR5_9RHOB|nr:3-oxoacyl-ACP reductase family protein [Maliponia aquimaris]SMX44459.1 3-oxoacyl-[acyl-carrier-protein] reductase FabG [Maliponia aquimaris]
MQNGSRLTGRTAFVSGSGQNIGRAIALRLADEGCAIVVNGSRDSAAAEQTAAMVRERGAEALVAMGDVSDAQAVQTIAKAALERFGRVDILVNNAAVRPHKPFLETTDEDWSRVIDTALTGAFRLSRAFLPGMVDNGWGRIVNFAGMKAIRGYFEGAPISAAKHGVWGMTKALSEEFAPKGITANVISPGQIRKETETVDDPKRVASIPVGSMGRPEDIAGTVAFLVSDDARFVTGQMIAVNGGEET